jgi:hypothetical protein
LALLGLLTLAWLGGCARSGATLILRQDLAPGAVQRTDTLMVRPAEAGKTMFLGDYADDPPSVATNREKLQGSYAPKLVAALRAAGFRAELLEGAEPPADAVVLAPVARRFDAGMAAVRVWSGSRSHLLIEVALTRGSQSVAQVTLDAFSDWHADVFERMDSHIDDSIVQLVNYLNEKLPQ